MNRSFRHGRWNGCRTGFCFEAGKVLRIGINSNGKNKQQPGNQGNKISLLHTYYLPGVDKKHDDDPFAGRILLPLWTREPNPLMVFWTSG